jgi:hypothetical protein
MPLSRPELDDLHKQSIRHRAQVKASAECGCFYCLEIFQPATIDEWTDDGETALCPKCGIDSVLPSGIAGYPITRALLEQMYARWLVK